MVSYRASDTALEIKLYLLFSFYYKFRVQIRHAMYQSYALHTIC